MTNQLDLTRKLAAALAVVALFIAAANAQRGNGGGNGNGGNNHGGQTNQLPANPDVVYVATKNDRDSIVLLDTATEETGPLVADARSPAWSPQGDRIAYFDAAGTIRVVNVDGTGDTVVLAAAAPAGYESSLDWSRADPPTGVEMLAWNTPAGIHAVALDGSQYALVKAGSYWTNPVWSPTGNQSVAAVYLPTGGHQLVVHSLGIVGGALAVVGETPLTHGPANPFGSPLVPTTHYDWSNSGDHIVLLAHELPSFDGDLWLIDAADPTVYARLTFTPEWERSPSFDAADARILYRDDGSSRRKLFAIDVAGGPAPQLLFENRNLRGVVRARRD